MNNNYSSEHSETDWETIKNLQDSDIDLSDIPEITEEQTARAVMRTPYPTKLMEVRLRADFLEAIQQAAEREGIPYQMLVQRWLREKLSQEAPDLLAS